MKRSGLAIRVASSPSCRQVTSALAAATVISLLAWPTPAAATETGAASRMVSAFSVTPTNLDFGSIFVGATASIDVIVTNISGATQSPNFAGGAPFDPSNFGGSQ